MVAKVTISKEVADAIEHALILQKEREKIIEFYCGDVDWTGICKPLNYIKLDQLIRAIYIGYEVETPEDRATKWLIDADCIVREKSPRDVARAMRAIFERGEAT